MELLAARPGELRAVKDPVECVIVARGDRVELVVVAARAFERQSEERLPDAVDRALQREVPQFVGGGCIPATEGQEAGGGHQFGVAFPGLFLRKEIPRLEPTLSAPEQVKQAEKESAAIIGFTSAIAAYGAFFIPTAYGTSIAITGGVEPALYGFLAFYVTCVLITWGVYTRKGGLLRDVERAGKKPLVPPTVQPAE